MKVTKAVFPVAGMGTRFLPATKSTPKEMLPIVDKPLIQYAVDEAIKAGIKDLIFVTSSSKGAIEDYFDTNHELETRLAAQQKFDLLDILKASTPPDVNCVYVRQPEPLGLGNAVLRARPVVGNQPFAVLLADDLIDCEDLNCLQQMMLHFDQTQESILAVEAIKPEQTKQYGVIDVASQHDNCYRLKGIVEKPAAKDAPSNLGVAGRYILTPAVFDYLDKTEVGRGGEIQLTDALSSLMQSEALHALQFKGKRFDCGSKLGYLKATVAFGLKHPELAQPFLSYLQTVSHETCEAV